MVFEAYSSRYQSIVSKSFAGSGVNWLIFTLASTFSGLRLSQLLHLWYKDSLAHLRHELKINEIISLKGKAYCPTYYKHLVNINYQHRMLSWLIKCYEVFHNSWSNSQCGIYSVDYNCHITIRQYLLLILVTFSVHRCLMTLRCITLWKEWKVVECSLYLC